MLTSSRARLRALAAASLAVVAAPFALSAPARAQTAGSPVLAPAPTATPRIVRDPASPVTGVVVDAEGGLPIADARVEPVRDGSGRPSPNDATGVTDANGHFTLGPLRPGIYRLRVSHDGYAPAFSNAIPVVPEGRQRVTLSLERDEQGTTQGVRTIGRTSTRASESLQRASTIFRTLSIDALFQSGTDRAGDALRQLPGVNNGITGDTASLGDDLQLSLRGIGTLETLATIDGHPIAEGAPGGGFNYQLTPIFALRNIAVTYGSGGSDVLGVNAIGGVVDQQTLEPTPDRRETLDQGYGTFSRLSTSLSATGTVEKLGYALAAGVATVDGPFKNDALYQPGAAYDQSATLPAVRNLGVYKDDGTETQRAALIKLSYDLTPNVRVTGTHLAETSFNDKTGNGDGDYLPGDTALALGNSQLASKSATDACPAGSFTATNVNGTKNGSGPGGVADGGVACQTPSQYAAFNTGFQGAGPAYQEIVADDDSLRLDGRFGASTLRIDAFSNRYLDTIDRYFALPFVAAPGDSPQGFVINDNVSQSGVSLGDAIALENDDLAFGATYLNNAYALQFDHGLSGAPVFHDTAVYVKNALRFDRDRFTAYTNAWFKRSTATNTSYVDPRLSVVYAPSSHDVFRVAYGASTAQPTADELGQTFQFSPPGGAGGGAAISCTSLNPIGNAPSAVLRPERGIDEEVAYGHRFSGDSQIQFDLYETNVYDKIYQATLPLAQAGASSIPSSQLASATAAVQARCGAVNAATLLGLSGNFNLGSIRARGFSIGGRQRLIARKLFLDYDYDVTSAALVSAPQTLLQNNLTLIQGSQLPHVPLHTATLSLDGALPHGVEVRYTVHTVSANNTKSLPAYDSSDLRIGAPLGPGSLAISISNLFDQNAFIEGLRGDGVPLPLNSYATAANYTPLIGTAATERFGLPYRQIFLSYRLDVR